MIESNFWSNCLANMMPIKFALVPSLLHISQFWDQNIDILKTPLNLSNKNYVKTFKQSQLLNLIFLSSFL